MRGAWFASGEIPVRAVRAGLIDRFGAIDNSEGGDTQRRDEPECCAGDVTVSRARFANGDEVPLAPRLIARGDLTAWLPWGLSASLEMRHLADRFASEDREAKARGYTLLDFTARYRYRALEAFVSIENLTNTEWREAQSVADLHFTPGTPRAVLGGLAWRF